ncbi:MAG TPA: formyltransferase family protein, partial [Candidatus Cloacimonadota bacterium]|nr:formyltransferase family protein [Candidatus Cloacimonadota bacterium]
MERTASEVRRIITLSSGYSRGSNLLAIHHYFADAKLPVCIQNAIFSSTKAPAILACEAEGIPATVIPAKDMTFFEYAVLKIIRDQQIELVALCGFMKLLSQEFINTCGIPILNIHPALLPRYGGAGMYGSNVHEAVFAAGEKRSGATIHLVDPIYDHGRIIAQRSIDISDCASPDEIAQKVLSMEHYLYPRAIERYLLHPQARIAIGTLGCKTNFFESASIFESFKDAVAVDFDSEADIYIINSCTVTNRADYKSRNLIRKALAKKELNPLIKIVVTGCFAQRSKEEIAALGDIDCIVDNQNKLDIAQILQGHERAWQDIMEAEDFVYRPVTNMLSHTRAFHKIQDGCDFYCAYCAVPYGRGHSRSAKFEDVIAQAELFCQSGFKEIVLGGVNLGLYRDQGRDLVDVVKAMSEIEELKLIRISSIEPQLLYPKMFAGLKDIPKLCPHFHIPLQSASDTILQRMGRHYDTALIKNLTS